MIGPPVRAAGVLLCVFAAGVLAGMFVERHSAYPMTAASAPMPVSHETTMAELRKVLELDDRQAAAIERVFTEHQQIVQQAWEELRPEVQEAMFEVHQEILGLIRSDQQVRFRLWLRQRHEGRPH